jgi:hypothetical protein
MKCLPLTAVLLALVAVAGCKKTRTPDKYIFAEGFTGGAVVIYNVASAPALPVVDGMIVVEFPADGVLETSSAMEDGWAKDQYFRHQGAQLKALSEAAGSEEVLPGYTGQTGSCPSLQTAFVGSKAQYDAMHSALETKLLGSVCKMK